MRLKDRLALAIARHILDSGFEGLIAAQQQHTKAVGPGVYPLPWPGPNGEVVCVVLNEHGQMIEEPQLCSEPSHLLALMNRFRRAKPQRVA